jgi:endonuclease/exonuclease/phosphatase (EEP) superfamily protein YafD
MGPIMQGVISNGIWWFVFFVGSALIALLTITHPTWATPVLYSIFAFCCFSVIFYAVTGHSLISKQKEQIDATNIEANVKSWIAVLGLASTPNNYP